MSRAFVKEDTSAPPDLPDLPISPHPNVVTPRGMHLLRQALAARQADLAALKARAERLDLLPEAAAERDIRYLSARLASAVLVDPAQHDLSEVAFGLIVTLADAEGTETRYQITGEDEADPAQGRITAHAPLARALIGAAVGDTVIWRRPTGALELEVIRLDHPPPPADDPTA